MSIFTFLLAMVTTSSDWWDDIRWWICAWVLTVDSMFINKLDFGSDTANVITMFIWSTFITFYLVCGTTKVIGEGWNTSIFTFTIIWSWLTASFAREWVSIFRAVLFLKRAIWYSTSMLFWI